MSNGQEAADRVRELVSTVGEALGLEGSVTIEEQPEGIRAVLEGDDLGLFIGRHGQTTDAVHHRAFKWANPDAAVHHVPLRVPTRAAARAAAVRGPVDAAGSRARREQALQRQAEQAADKAVTTGRPVALDAMSATERKVVHEFLKDREGVETYSEGTEPNRHLVVAPL